MVAYAPYGEQPLAKILRQRHGYCADVAKQLGLSYRQVWKAAHGIVAPSPYLRDQLPPLLGIPLSRIFNERALAPAYDKRAASGGTASYSKIKTEAGAV